MAPKLVPWPDVELLHNVVTTLAYLLRDFGKVPPTVNYRSKVKLHGVNCAVQITPEGVFPQSRGQILSADDERADADGSGTKTRSFAKWVKAHEFYWKTLPINHVVFGEWCGLGIESGMAISQVPEKQFAIFAVQVGLDEATAQIVYKPDDIKAILPKGWAAGNMHVLPWEETTFLVDFTDREDLEAKAALVNEAVLAAEREDPWVKRTFGITGLGEGLVLYPVGMISVEENDFPTTPTAYAALMWKAKGEKHRTTKVKVAAQVDPVVVNSIAEFVALMVTPARLVQGVAACGGSREAGNTRGFLAWVTRDVQKESVDELAAAGLTWAQVEKAVQAQARTWYLQK